MSSRNSGGANAGTVSVLVTVQGIEQLKSQLADAGQHFMGSQLVMPQRVVIDAKFEILVILDSKDIIKVVNKGLLENSEIYI